MVALKNSVCRWPAGAAARAGCRAGIPCRASGRPRRAPGTRCPASLAYGERKWSSRRPGVATRTSTPLRKACSCGPIPTPPKTAAPVTGVWTARSFRSSRIWAASSRVGVRISARVVPAGLVDQPVQDRQQERRRLSAARHGAGEHVPSRKRRRDGIGLDRCRAGEAELLDALQKARVEVETTERHGVPPRRRSPSRPIGGGPGRSLRPACRRPVPSPVGACLRS